MSFADLLAIVGGMTVAFYLLKLTWRCWCGFREFVLSSKWQVDLRTYGQWAVVTGATSGIGKAYATELAQRGLDIVLISRCDNKLQAVAREIEGVYGRKTQTIPVDFTHGYSIYPAIAKKLQGLQIGILVNNVGMTTTDCFAYFLETPDAEQKITQVINCNILSVPQMTRLVLPDMVKRCPSTAFADALLCHQDFCNILLSVSPCRVQVKGNYCPDISQTPLIAPQCVAPFLVSTNMTKTVKVNSFMKSATAFAREALNTVGHSSCTTGCLSHAVQNAFLTILLPDRLRMSTFLIRKLRSSCKKNDWTGEKGE
ncbi:hydroxysteroid (20-beta) dehydrogenase 2 isoform X3 [Oreochromis aureus]|uniref:hydroxysteroid (20-beta) dehydrogenase 2 isoform X3 n=1 Tax=Oreochromis aureus TaxID=47969 RepID=UPI0019549AA3|nr:hydroxysteroid (20-beta) dehydrogenase 2 isoform X3 [Oreochromis aureus]